MPAPGVLLVDKPGGMTSHDVVARARKALGTRKIGHAGTLDPMATGLLILGVEAATRLLTFIVGLDKTYEATIRLGASTDTDDADGEIVAVTDAAAVDSAAVSSAIADLTGEISQVPSRVSAIKVAGRRAYDLARAGEEVELAARTVTVSRFDVRDERRDGGFLDLDVVVDCTSGTYIRALARDLGAALGVGGHLTALRRTRIGPFGVEDAASVDDLATATLRDPAEVADRRAGGLPGLIRRGPGSASRQAPRRRGSAPARRPGGDRSRRQAHRRRGAPRRRRQERHEPARGGLRMILWFTIAQVAVAVAAGLLCVILGLAGRRPSDLSVGGLALLELLLIVQIVIAIIAPLAGNPPTGSLLEFWVYLVSAALLPPAAVAWALLERSRWSTVIMGVAALAVGVMVWRMYAIWTIQIA